MGGISLGGIVTIVGVLLAIFVDPWWIGVIVALIGLVALGGFARGRWY